MRLRLVLETDGRHADMIEHAVNLLLAKHPGEGSFSYDLGDGELEAVLTVFESEDDE